MFCTAGLIYTHKSCTESRKRWRDTWHVENLTSNLVDEPYLSLTEQRLLIELQKKSQKPNFIVVSKSLRKSKKIKSEI